jgi:MFS family permease
MRRPPPPNEPFVPPRSIAPPRLPGSTYLLTLAQAIHLTCAVISVAVAAVVGTALAPSRALGTIPYGIQFAAMMLCTYPASMLMRRSGRRRVFSLGALLLIASGVSGYLAAQHGSFGALTAAHALLGAFMACAGFYRFAAVDHVAAALKPRAISLVVSGGVLAALAGPALASTLRSVAGFADFSLCYATLGVMGVATLGLMALWHEPAPSPRSAAAATATEAGSGWTLPVSTAIFCSAGAYLMMNLLMVQSSLVMKDICSFSASSRAIQAHVLAMFLPSFVTGPLIARIGLRATLVTGFVLLLGAAAAGTLVAAYEPIVGGLVLLGLGWNFVYVGGGALLARHVSDSTRHRWQGLNDTAIAACATLGAFLPAPLLSGVGWNVTNILLMPMCAAGIVLCWTALPRAGNGMGASVRA